MTDAVEVAIESALLNRVVAFAGVVKISLPNVSFTPPTPGPSVYWLQATFLPADSFALGVDYGADNQHYGILQVTVFYGAGVRGELEPARIAAQIIAYFKRGTKVTKDGFTAEIFKTPFRGQMRQDKDPAWVMIPVTIPYIAFAPPPA